MACTPPSAHVFKNLRATWSRGVGCSGDHNQGIGKAVNMVLNPLGCLEDEGDMDVDKLKDLSNEVEDPDASRKRGDDTSSKDIPPAANTGTLVLSGQAGVPPSSSAKQDLKRTKTATSSSSSFVNNTSLVGTFEECRRDQ